MTARTPLADLLDAVDAIACVFLLEEELLERPADCAPAPGLTAALNKVVFRNLEAAAQRVADDYVSRQIKELQRQQAPAARLTAQPVRPGQPGRATK